jgi:hypothetical protein
MKDRAQLVKISFRFEFFQPSVLSQLVVEAIVPFGMRCFAWEPTALRFSRPPQPDAHVHAAWGERSGFSLLRSKLKNSIDCGFMKDYPATDRIGVGSIS